MQRLKQQLAQLERRRGEAREKVTLTQKVVLQQDPQQARGHALLALQRCPGEEERRRRQGLEHELETLKQQLERLEKMEVKEGGPLRASRWRSEHRAGDSEAQGQSGGRALRGKRELDRGEPAGGQAVGAGVLQLQVIQGAGLPAGRRTTSCSWSGRASRRRPQAAVRGDRVAWRAQEPEEPAHGGGARPEAPLGYAPAVLERGSWTDLRRLSRDKDQEIEELQRRLGSVAVKREQRENHLRALHRHRP